MAKRKSNSKASATIPADGYQSMADEVIGSVGAAITDEQVKRMENGAAANEIGQVRRVTLGVCSRTGLELRKISQESPEVFEAMVDAVEQFLKHTKALNDVAEAAYTRLLVAYHPGAGRA